MLQVHVLQPCAESAEGERSGEQRHPDQQEDPGAACRGLASAHSVLPLCMSAVLHEPVGALRRLPQPRWDVKDIYTQRDEVKAKVTSTYGPIDVA